MSTNGTDIGGLYISLGLDASSFNDDFLRAVEGASGPASRLKERIQGLAQSMADLRKETQSVKDQLASAADFRVRGTDALDKLHEQLGKVRDAGGVTDKTLDQLSLKFEEASRGARTYVQALDRVANDKSAANSTRELARTLADEAREANYAAAQLDKQLAALQRLGSQQARRLASTVNVYRQQEQESVPQRSATSGVVRVASGELSVRAAETFLSGTLGLGSFFEKIFPVAGGLAVLGILDELIGRGNHLYEAYKKFEAEADTIREAFARLNNEIATSNDELRVTNDRLANDIAALQGQPQNRLKEMLDEARVAADKLADSLQKDLDKLQKTFNDQNISGWERLLGNATDSGQLKKELFGENEHGGLRGDVQDITARYQKEIRRLADEEATAPPEQKQQLLTQQNTVRSNATRDIGNRFQAEIDPLQKRLEHERQLQEQYQRYRAGNPELRLAAITQEQQGGQAPEFTYDQTRLIERDRKIIDTLKDLRESSLEQFKSIELTQAKDITPDLRPYQDKLRELAAQFQGLKSQLASIGGTETAKTLAKSWTDAQEAITKLNNELINKGQPGLNAAQQAAIIAAEDKNAQIKGEVEWKEKLQQTTTSINERIESLKRLTSAIGEGYDAQKRAFVENEVAKFTAPFANDPDALKRRQGDIEVVRQKATGQFEAQQANAVKADLEKLNTQIELETRLAGVEAQGAEAVRQATLAFEHDQAAKDRSADASQRLADAERKLSDIQAQRKTNEFLAQLQRETDATNRLADAQSRGADAVRKAQLENKLAQVLPGIPEAQRPEVEKKLRADAAAQEQLQIAQQADSIAQAYQRQLDSIDKQIAYLQQKKALSQDIANDEIGIQKLEEERAKVYAQQVAVLGSAREGMRAFFQEMATNGVSAAAEVHDALTKTFDSLNDSLAKLVAGQKVSWSSFFSGISEQLTKNSLQNLEKSFASAFTQQPGESGKAQGEQPSGFLSRLGHALSDFAHPHTSSNPAVTHPSVHEQIGTPESPLSKIGGSRDGQSAASALFVTTVDAGTSANPVPSSAALPPPGAVSNPTANPLEALGNNLPTPPPFRQNPGQLSLPEAISRVEGFGANPGNIPTRLNNPGDIKYGSFAAKYGATADQTGFAKFPSVQVGKQAELDLLKSPGYANLPLSQAIPRYNGTNQPNNPEYLKAIQKFTGLSPDTLVREALRLIPGFAEGGRPDPNKPSFVGENGIELFIPDVAGTIIPNDELASFSALMPAGNGADGSKANSFAQFAHLSTNAFSDRGFGGLPEDGGDSSKALNSLADANALQNAMYARQTNPKAFDKTQQTEQFTNVSLPTKTPSFGEVLFDAAASGLTKSLSGGADGGGALGSTLASGIRHLFGGNSPSTDPSALSIGDATDPFGGNPAWQQLPKAPAFSSLGMRATRDLSSAGVAVGLGLLSHALFDRPHDHHFKPGDPYYIPNFNAALAEGGDVKAGGRYLTGEKGRELFVPSSLAKLAAYSTDSPCRRLSAAVGMKEVLPFGGYRAMGGGVDANQSYEVGESGPEAWASPDNSFDSLMLGGNGPQLFTPPVNGGAIVPHSALSSSNGQQHVYIDARGTDPAAVDARVRKAMEQTHKHAVKTSFKAVQEWNARMPEGASSPSGWS